MNDNNVTALFPDFKPVPIQNSGIIKEKPSGGDDMEKNYYTKDEIDLKLDKISSEINHSSEKSNFKLEKLEQNMNDGFGRIESRFNDIEKRVELRFDNFEKRIENMFLTQENKRLEEQAKNKKEFTYWAIGILVALAGIAFPIWFGK